MKLLNLRAILRTIKEARKKYTNGTLDKDIQSATVESFWLDIKKSPIIRKQQLIQIAKNGENRPNSRKHPLGIHLCQYTNQSGKCYDPVFTKKIKSIAPHWFINATTIKKQQLIQLAKSKQPRPIKSKHPLGVALSSYTRTSHKSYDPKFTKQIKSLAPHWFIKSSTIKKQQLIQLAKSKQPRPHVKNHPLGHAFNSYISKLNSSYDPVFTQKMKSLTPHWFVSQSDIANQKKQQIIHMARTKQNRPNKSKHPLGRVFSNYTRTNGDCYDPIFTKKIKSIAPHWFKK